MPKRVKNEELPAPESPEAAPRKRSRKDTKVEETDDIVDVDPEPEQESNGSSSDHEGNAPKDSGRITRDPDYYFADGSVVVRADDVLFKVHASLLGARSEVFREIFNVPVGGSERTEGDEPAVKREDQDNDEDKAPNSPRGTSDGHPIVIDDVISSQFRNLLKVIYCLPSDDSVAILERNASGERGYDRLDLLADVIELSRQFSIPDLEKWAVNQLEGLLESHTETIGRHIGEVGDVFDWLVLVLDGAKAAAPRLVYGLRYLIQYSCHNPDPLAALGDSLRLFRIKDLRNMDEALYGYAFLLLLNRGHKAWAGEEFSQMDRMALFSAQSYLTPLPKSLYEGMKSPLFVKPDSAITFSEKVSSKTTERSCIDKCHKAAFRAWREEFNARYYDSVNGPNTLTCIDTLASLPWRRLKFAHKVRAQTCHFGCFDKIVGLVDRDLERLYTRLAGYYKAIE